MMGDKYDRASGREKTEMTMSAELLVPDGGRGWTVVAASALINVFNQSLLSMFGLVFGAKLESLAGTTGVTTVMSLNCTISNFSGFLISPMSKYLGQKQITQIGILLVSLGMAISAFTKSYTVVIIAYGVLTGLGLGLIASSSFLLVNSYFDKNKSQAVGLSMAGTSIGQMIMPLVVALFIEHYGYNGTILILSGLSLHGFAGTIFFDPVTEHMVRRDAPRKPKTSGLFSNLRKRICCKHRNDEQKCDISHNTEIDGNMNNKSDVDEIKLFVGEEAKTNNVKLLSNNDRLERNTFDKEIINNVDESSKQDENESTFLHNTEPCGEEKKMFSCEHREQEETSTSRTSWWWKFVRLLGLQVLLDPIFVHIMIGLSLAYTTSISFSTFFPLFLTEDLEMGLMEASSCMTALSLMDFTGRILVPFITKKLQVTHRTTFTVGSLVLAGCRSALALQKTYVTVLVFSCICGLARAATVINQNLVVAEYSKDSQISSAVGLNMVSKGIFVLTIGRLLGVYKDSAHNFSSCIHILDIISVSVVISWSIEIVLRKLCTKRKRQR